MQRSTISGRTIGVVSVVIGLVLVAVYVCAVEFLGKRLQPEDIPEFSSRNRVMHGWSELCENTGLMKTGHDSAQAATISIAP